MWQHRLWFAIIDIHQAIYLEPGAMKYPFHTQSMPVVGHEAQRLLSAIDQGTYVANDTAIATAKRIAERRKTREDVASHTVRELVDATRR